MTGKKDKAIFKIEKDKNGVHIDSEGFNGFELLGYLFYEMTKIIQKVDYVQRLNKSIESVPVKKPAKKKKTIKKVPVKTKIAKRTRGK